MAKQALKEESVFLRVIGVDDWPQYMDTARENLHRTTLCDKELESNRGNDTDVLPCLWTMFKSLYPAKAKAIESGQREQQSGDTNTDDPPNPPENEQENAGVDAPSVSNTVVTSRTMLSSAHHLHN